MTMIDPRTALAEAETAVAQAHRLDALAAAQQKQVDAAARSVADARRELDAEASDVDRLERMSFASVLAALRGDRDDRLAREKAERDAARFRLEAASGLEAELASRRAETLRRRADLGDVDAALDEARRATQELILRHGAAGAEELEGLLRRAALLEVERDEVGEAIAAARAARGPLDAAAAALARAGGWSAYDIVGGGFIADLVKRSEMDGAADSLRAADVALRALSAELADLGSGAASDLGDGDIVSAFDLWFDDIFSSWAVHGRITDAQARVGEARQAVAAISARLAEQALDVAKAIADVEDRRARILRA
ncbi:hypothetical protein [Microbacterium indicum]|uniref:hypothetical protein n=1 Tax=Microbacterium indicum TaxID=358100 RepID=UPI00055C887F|nr:hypothetical protein [Microbacterium indicum]